MKDDASTKPLFRPGKILATPGALDLLERTGTGPFLLLHRHCRGDWGTVCDEDAAANSQAILVGNRILSAYDLGNEPERVWVITEADRSATTLLLPCEN
ncbi:hypothetical protein RA280_38925 [Cupriavidus sp. CV2]|uniref:hypothetical protein n=1 Tax=Cupriavidus ulmosensis TaxID=3065913 RepID=UPI00296AB3D0|nr:hypothetical protein [Cupriavidus sp. CV2]MDW3687607.1 hypothetical protein [Cupriavidus sp. CV2]